MPTETTSILPFVPYEGPEPYIFVSYAHANKGKVYPIIKQLHEMGYRLWYDEGIQPGKEWGDEVQRHLESAAMMLLFLTPLAVERKNVRSEIQFAWSKDIQILGVDLVETRELKYGLGLWLQLCQRVLFYTYTDKAAFYEKLLKGLPEKAKRPEQIPATPLTPEQKPELVEATPDPAPAATLPQSNANELPDLGDLFGSFFGGHGGQPSKSDQSSKTCLSCIGTGKIIVPQQTPFGVISSSKTCPRCKGSGKIAESTSVPNPAAEKNRHAKPCLDCDGTGKTSVQQRTPFGTISTSKTCPKCNGSGKAES